jgi:hypothetical protein
VLQLRRPAMIAHPPCALRANGAGRTPATLCVCAPLRLSPSNAHGRLLFSHPLTYERLSEYGYSRTWFSSTTRICYVVRGRQPGSFLFPSLSKDEPLPGPPSTVLRLGYRPLHDEAGNQYPLIISPTGFRSFCTKLHFLRPQPPSYVSATTAPWPSFHAFLCRVTYSFY